MTNIEFQNKLNSLKDSLHNIVNEYIESNKQYNVGDILRISFTRNGKQYVKTCKIVNIYLTSDDSFMTSTCWPTTNIVYFARYCWKCNEEIQLGTPCPLGNLSCSRTICGYAGIDENTLKIETIKESEL